jgi:hypothetical protein
MLPKGPGVNQTAPPAPPPAKLSAPALDPSRLVPSSLAAPWDHAVRSGADRRLPERLAAARGVRKQKPPGSARRPTTTLTRLRVRLARAGGLDASRSCRVGSFRTGCDAVCPLRAPPSSVCAGQVGQEIHVSVAAPQPTTPRLPCRLRSWPMFPLAYSGPRPTLADAEEVLKWLASMGPPGRSDARARPGVSRGR